MEYFIISFITIIYYIGAAFIFYAIAKRTKRLWLKLTIAFALIIFPLWDWLLGVIVYYPSCLFVPKVAIYQTAETEGIYYEGKHDSVWELARKRNDQLQSELLRVGLIDYDFYKGFKYGEAKVTKKEISLGPHGESITISPTCYRCTPLLGSEKKPEFTPTNCLQIEHPQSRYLVKQTTISIGIAEIGVKKVIDRHADKLMAEYRQVKRYMFGLPPFWFWLYSGSGVPDEISCPFDGFLKTMNGRFITFEYMVLRPQLQNPREE